MKASDCVFMSEGIILDGFIRESELHGPLRFRYRPCNSVDKAKLARRMSNQADAERKELIAAAFMAEKLESWEAEPDITKEVIAFQLHPAVNLKLYNILTGTWASDPVEDPTIPGTEDGVDLEEAAGN